MEKGKTAAIIVADNSPDWNPSSLLNAVFYMRLWRDLNLDMLLICSDAAHHSAYNPIEHLWSPLTKKLSSVRLSAVAPGDTKAPCNMALKSDERKQKEAIVFDEAVKEVC